jgi:hypothetical protein
MGGCHSQALSQTPIAAYAQTHSRSQVHEVAVMPLTTTNFPTPDCPAFQRLHEIYRTCPRVRQHFANAAGEEPLALEAFYHQVVIDASHPRLPNATSLPVAVATRWRGDEQWDIAGYIGCRGFADDGELNEVNHLQMFFKDGHKVPLTMPAIQLAARLFAEMHILSTGPNSDAEAQRVPWPNNCEWTIRRHNMEVRRVLEAVLVFWDLRPSRTGTPDQAPPPAPAVGPFPMTLLPYVPLQVPAHQFAVQMQGRAGGYDIANRASFADAAPHLGMFPLERRSLTEDLLTLGTGRGEAVASLLADLASWSSPPARWTSGSVTSLGLDGILPANFVASGGRVLLTGLSMNFRGTQQKTPAERRDILGGDVADMLELIQPLPRDPAEQEALDQMHQARKEKKVMTQQQQQMMMQPPRYGATTPVMMGRGVGGGRGGFMPPPPQYAHAMAPQLMQLPNGQFVQAMPAQSAQQPMMFIMNQPQQQIAQPQPVMLNAPPPGFTYALVSTSPGGAVQPVLVPTQQQPQQQQMSAQPTGGAQFIQLAANGAPQHFVMAQAPVQMHQQHVQLLQQHSPRYASESDPSRSAGSHGFRLNLNAPSFQPGSPHASPFTTGGMNEDPIYVPQKPQRANVPSSNGNGFFFGTQLADPSSDADLGPLLQPFRGAFPGA